MSKLTLDNFRRKVSSTIYRRGEKYYKSGSVIYANEITPGHYDALVMGSGTNYRVNILFEEDEIVQTKCTCPYDWGDTCKHVIATLLEIKGERIIPVPTVTRQNIPEEKIAVVPAEKQMETYLTLGPTVQRIIKITALGWLTFSQTKIAEAFNKCNFKNNGKNLYPSALKPMLKRLVEMGYLTLDRNNKYACHKGFADELCQQFYSKDADFLKIAKYLKFNSSSYYYSYNEYVNNIFRDMRIARYSDKPKDFEEYYYAVIRHPHTKYTQETLCNYWLPALFNLERIEQLPLSIRAFLLKEKLTLQLFNLAKTDDYFSYAVENISIFGEKDTSELARLLGIIFILRGEWDKLEKITPQFAINPIDLGLITAIRQFIVGSTEAALESFDLSLKLLKKKSRNNKIHLYSLEGIFHLLTRLKTQNETLHRKIDSHITWVLKQGGSYETVFHWLKGVRLFLKNEKKEGLNLIRYKSDKTPIITFFKPFCLFWIDDTKVDKNDLKKIYKKTNENGYQWMAYQLLVLWDAIEPDNAKILALLDQQREQLGTIAPLINVLPRIEEWEMAVKALTGLGVSAAANNSGENRLAWLIDFEYDRIQARGQTLNKNGWTKGRAIAFKRLRDREISYLSAQDERIIQAINYGDGSEIHIYESSIWKQLVGHPLLFLWKSPEVAVQLIEESPRLIARKEAAGFRLSLSHQVSESGFQIIKESPTRYILLEVTEKIAQIAKAFNGKALNVPEKGAAPLKKAIAGLSNIIQVESAFEEENLPTVEADARACVHLLPVGDGFHVEVYAKPFNKIPPYVKIGQGEPTIITLLDGVKTATNRDLKKEKKNLKDLREAVPILQETRPKAGIWELEDAERCLELLVQLAPLIEDKKIILEWPKGEKFRISQIVGIDQFRVEINEKNNWFELKGQLPIDEGKVLTMQELLALSEQSGQFIELSQGKFLALTEEFRRRLEQINGLVSSQKNGTLQLHPLAAPAIQDFTDALQHLKIDAKFKENQERLKKAFSKKFRVSKKFQAILRPYQQEGFQWLHRCAAWGVGACLADDMGLGKTIQALALLTDRAKLGPALVVAPASVCRNWVAETERFAPTLTPVLFGEGDRQATIKKAKKGTVIIVTYDLMTREGASFIEKQFATIILDEAQAIKNRATKRSEVAMDLQGDFKIAMTGTPVENHLGELWNLFQFINPGLLGSLDSFNKRFALPIEKNKDFNRREQLRKLLQPFILRRKKDEVLKDLPEKTEITLTATLSPEERAFYEALRRNAIEKLAGDDSHGGQKHLRILVEIMKLRRAACHPKLADETASFIESAKLQLFSGIVEELLANGHRALVFSQFVGHLAILEAHLKKQKISYQYLDGSTPLAKRQERIDAFQAGEGAIFLISLKAGGTGLNLTAADYVIHMDPWWNPAVEDQATDRAHRIGQQRPVTVYRLVAEGTIEEKILQLHEKKRDLADSLLAGTDVSAKLTADDLLNLIAES